MAQSNDDKTACCPIFNFKKKDLLKSGFYHSKCFENVVCCGCGWQSDNTRLSLKHINFMHKILNPSCEMSKYIKEDVLSYCKSKQYIEEFEKMMRETFLKWTKENPVVEELVQAGFCYTGIGDATACVACGVILDNWSETDVPREEHEKANPHCELFCI